MTRWRLEPEAGGPAIDIPEGRTVVVGRAAASDIHLADDTVSRQHAELMPDARGIRVRDLSSVNGTLHNDEPPVDGRRAVAGDVLTFGRVRFRVIAGDAAETPPVLSEKELPPGTQVRAMDVRSGGGALGRLRGERLARLVELAQELSGEIDTPGLLRRIVERAAALLPADRVALLVSEEPGGELRAAHTSNRLGGAPVRVPASIARRAVAERMPIVTESARDDQRFQSGSVVKDQVRAALCVPLLTEQDSALGVLYVDSLTATGPFSEEEVALCFAFAGLAAVSIATARAVAAARRQGVIQANFERFFAPEVAARIAATPSGVRPGGERRGVTILFSDVRGFTGLAETMEPEAVAQHLSSYFAVMVELVFEFGGTLDKFMGDALLAVWGAPGSAPGDTDRALLAATAMQEELVVLNRQWARQGRPALSAGIGLHHGEAFAGTIGSARRLDYTVIGDVVNVAARICQAADPGEILISEAVRARLDRLPGLVPLPALSLRGREGAITVFKVGEL